MVPDHVLVEQAADGVLHPKADVPHLKKAGDDRRQNAGGQQKPHAYLRPDKPVDDVVYLRYPVEKLLHTVHPSAKNSKKTESRLYAAPRKFRKDLREKKHSRLPISIRPFA